MITAGIIAEYNPFHEGHRYHIEETKRRTGADYVVVAMSGDYVQRGEPAIVDKYIRTRMALEGGADLVLELPCAYATASAEHFAAAGVMLLHKLGAVDWLSFGSEWADREELLELAEILCREPGPYKSALREGLKEGLSYPAARARALCSLLPDDRRERARRLLEEPNHILGLEYMKAIRKTGAAMSCLVVARQGRGYHDQDIEGADEDNFASAAAIRAAVVEDPSQPGLAPALGAQYMTFMEYIDKNEYVLWEDLMPFLRYAILYDKEMLSRYSGTDLELARRINNLYRPEYSFAELMAALHVKNRTDTALKRALLRIFLQISQQPYLNDGVIPLIPYARVLGFRRQAAPLLRRIREKTSLDIIQRPSLAKKTYTRYSHEMDLYRCDINGADLYEQIVSSKSQRKPVRELTREQIIL